MKKITKKEIRNIALETLPSALATKNNNDKKASYYLTTKKVGKMLVVCFWELGNILPSYRLFLTSEDYLTQDLTKTPYKLYKGSVWSILYTSNLSFLRQTDEDTFLAFYQKKIPTAYTNEPYYLIERYEELIREQRLKEVHQKEMDRIDREMEKFSKLPRNYSRFVEKQVFFEENYLFFDKKAKTVFCTACKKESPILKPKAFMHNQEGICPKCKRTLLSKSVGRSKTNKNLTKVKWSLYVEQYEEDVLLHYSMHEKTFEDYKNPKITSKELYRMSLQDYKWYRYTNFKGRYSECWCNFEQIQMPSIHTFPIDGAYLYNKELDFSNSCLKYSGTEIFVSNALPLQERALSLPYYVSTWREHPYLEKLVKLGFYQLATAIYKDPDFYQLRYHLRLNPKANKACELLDLSRLKFKLLQDLKDPTVRDVEILQSTNKEVSKTDFLTVRNITKTIIPTQVQTLAKHLFEFSGNLCTLEKYLKKQHIEENSYFDYFEDIKFLGYDLKNKSNLYPKDFLKLHNERAREVALEKEEIYKGLIKRYNAKLQGMKSELDIEDSNYLVRFPYELDELKKEGESLHHCVARYMDKVAKGETMILFVREKTRKDKPFYTLEWNEKGLVQCRGFADKSYIESPPMRTFVDTKVIPYMQTLAS